MPLVRCACGHLVDSHPNARRAHWAGKQHRVVTNPSPAPSPLGPINALCLGRPLPGAAGSAPSQRALPPPPPGPPLRRLGTAQRGSRDREQPRDRRPSLLPGLSKPPSSQASGSDLPDNGTPQPAGSSSSSSQPPALPSHRAPPLAYPEAPEESTGRLEVAVGELARVVQGLQQQFTGHAAETERARLIVEKQGLEATVASLARAVEALGVGPESLRLLRPHFLEPRMAVAGPTVWPEAEDWRSPVPRLLPPLPPTAGALVVPTEALPGEARWDGRSLRFSDLPSIPISLGYLITVKAAFQSADMDNSGSIDVASLGRYCMQKGLRNVSFGQLMKMIDAADPTRTGAISFLGFLGIQLYMALNLKSRHVPLRDWVHFCCTGLLPSDSGALEESFSTQDTSGSRHSSRPRDALERHLGDAAVLRQLDADDIGLSSATSEDG